MHLQTLTLGVLKLLLPLALAQWLHSMQSYFTCVFLFFFFFELIQDLIYSKTVHLLRFTAAALKNLVRAFEYSGVCGLCESTFPAPSKKN